MAKKDTVNWLDPDDVRAHIARRKAEFSRDRFLVSMDVVMEEFVRALKVADPCCPDICDGANWQEVARIIVEVLDE